MTPNRTITTITGMSPVSRTMQIITFLGTAFLMTCLLSGVAQAADTGSSPAPDGRTCSIGFNGDLSAGTCPTGSTQAETIPEAAQTAMRSVNSFLVDSGDTATFINVTEESGMYRIGLVVSSTQQTGFIYVSKDGKILSASYYDMTVQPLARISAASADMTSAPTKNVADLRKQDTPELQAFVASYCPYGVQMQDILTDIITQAPALKENIKVRYIGEITDGVVQSMHGETEAGESIRQICIREEQGDKYWDYVSCFGSSGSAGTCVKSAGLSNETLSRCISDTSRGLHYAEEDFALASAFGISSSPTLVLNNETISEFDYGGRTPEVIRSILCGGFTSKPEACDIALSATRNAAGSVGQC